MTTMITYTLHSRDYSDPYSFPMLSISTAIFMNDNMVHHNIVTKIADSKFALSRLWEEWKKFKNEKATRTDEWSYHNSGATYCIQKVWEG